MDNLPIYLITIDEDDSSLGVDMIAFTNIPAIETKGFAFSKDTVSAKRLFFSDIVKQRIVAPVMIPDLLIYREDKTGGFYVKFTAENIEKIHSKMMKDLSLGKPSLFNEMHNSNKPVPAYLLETWIVGENPKADKAWSEYEMEVPPGTLMAIAQITDKKYFSHLVDNGMTGFSIEGALNIDVRLNKKKKMSKSFKNHKRFSAFSKIEQDVNTEVTIVAEELVEGAEVVVIDETLSPNTSYTGEVTTEAGKTISIEEGVISSIESEAPAKEEEVAMEVKEEEKVVKEEEIIEEKAAYSITPEEQTAIVSEVMQILEGKLEEIYSMIAELKTTTTSSETLSKENASKTEEKDVLLARMHAFNKFASKKNKSK
jgi:hypothetical protein